MLQLLFYKLGFLEKYSIEYNSLIIGQPNEFIEFYYFKNCPKFFLKEAALDYLRGRIITMTSRVVYIENIGNYKFSEQFIY